MTDQQWQRSAEILQAVLALEPSRRETFLDQECAGDRMLKGMVVSLLGFVDQETAALRVAIPGRPGSEQELAQLGSYKILRVLGEGGMGVVYLAEQSEPIHRRVALKVIKLGMDTKEVIARFEAERQALALMEHPNIARVYDAGASGDGRPYFAMEYVEGVPITEYCDRHKASIVQRLRLFLQVCHAIEHAHHRGIIHRDIKATNVLVTSPDQEPIAKVIDFGVARATNQRLTEKTIYTEVGRAVGTPAYMSPEQAEMTGEGVDHRTDVYSLGVLLYELLIGQLPMDLDVESVAFDEIMRRIREEDPPTPSARWSQLNLERTSKLAAERATNPATLKHELRGDLDWVCMKALEKERGRRYETAAHLRDDVERYLGKEPVVARRPSAVYRLRKYVRKNRVPVVATCVVVAALIVGLLASVVFAVDARESSRKAQENLKLAIENEKEAKTNLELARVNEDLAERRLKEVYRLSDLKGLEDFRKEADELWPASSGKIDALSEWLGKARELAASLVQHRATLWDLRARALPYTEEDRKCDRETHPKAGRLADAEQKLRRATEELAKIEKDASKAETEGAAELKQERGRIEETVAALDAEVSTRRTWRFEDKQNRWWHDTLQTLVEGLEAFTDRDPFKGTIASVEERLAFAREVRNRTLEGDQVKKQWRQAIERIRRSPRFGFDLRPQEGLIPLGPDPVSGLEEFAHLQTGDAPERDGDGKLILTSKTGLVFVLLPGGTFQMGATRLRLGVRFSQTEEKLEIAEVVVGSLADRAAVKPGDVLVALNEKAIKTPDDIREALSELEPGTNLRFAVVRKNGEKVLSTAELGPNPDPQADEDEAPVDEVTLTPFLLSKYEMTQSQWLRFTGENPSQYQPGASRRHRFSLIHPVEQVSWEMCDDVLGKLGLLLPTEAQWEYGCRAGTATVWWTGDSRESLQDAANLADLFCKRNGGPASWTYEELLDDGYTVHARVGSFRGNAFGLHDVHGNVAEWCRDGYGSYTLPVGEGDGERQVGPASTRVCRGGGYSSMARLVRSANRGNNSPDFLQNSIGVRPARRLLTE